MPASFFGGVSDIFSGPDFSGIRNLPLCDIRAEPAAISSAAAGKLSADIPMCKADLGTESCAVNPNSLII